MQFSETKETIASEWSNNDKPYEAEKAIINPSNVSLILKDRVLPSSGNTIKIVAARRVSSLVNNEHKYVMC